MPGKAHSIRATIASSLSRALHFALIGSFFYLHRLVALAEIGDKTQLLSFVLAAKLRRPYPIMAGNFCRDVTQSCLGRHRRRMAGRLISPQFLNWIIALSFIGFALWTLKPDTLDERPAHLRFRNIPDHAHCLLHGGNGG